jgi:integrase
MVAFLVVLPIRRRAFAGLEIGRSFLCDGRRMSVVLDGSLTKTGQPWETEVPRALVDLLVDHLEHVRPCLAERSRSSSRALWLNDQGEPYAASYLGRCIGLITEELVGVRIPPHFFRDCAATTLAYDSPDSARLTRGLLGHSSFRTAEKHYNQATMIDAGRSYAGLIANLSK